MAAVTTCSVATVKPKYHPFLFKSEPGVAGVDEVTPSSEFRQMIALPQLPLSELSHVLEVGLSSMAKK
jgi:hypothetical protein